jgi:hypothetical protein
MTFGSGASDAAGARIGAIQLLEQRDFGSAES